MASPKFNLPFSLGLADAAPDSVDPRIKPILDELYNAFQQLQIAFHSYVGVGQQLESLWSQLSPTQTLHLGSQTRIYREATEVIAYGAAINLFSSGGAIKMRNANATNNTRPCHGFCTTEAGIAIGAYGEAILFRGVLGAFAGLVQGSRYFLSTVNGLITTAAPVAAGNIEQPVGLALDSTTLLFEFGLDYIQH